MPVVWDKERQEYIELYRLEGTDKCRKEELECGCADCPYLNACVNFR